MVAAAADLRVRLLWLTLFRTVATTLILGVLAAQLSSGAPRSELSTADLTSFGIIAFSYVLTLVTGLLLRAGRVGPGAAWTQIVFDVLLASSVVFLTGGARSPFTFLFLVSIVGAAVLLGTRGAIVGFLGAATAYLLVLASLLESHPSESLPRLGLDALIQLVAQLLIAVLSGYVGEQLSRTGGRLSASERDLRELIELQDEIVRAMPSGLVTCDPDGVVTFVNPSAEAILGISTEEVTRRARVDELLPGAKALIPGRRSELRVATPRGDRVLGLSVTPLSSAEGLLIVFQDLTELRRIERELDSIDHLATLGRLSAQLAHEIRNPLAAMRGSAQMLVGDSAGSPGEGLARLILRESDRLAGLVEGYLKLARPPPPQLARTRVDVVVRETLELLRADPAFAGVQVDESLESIEAVCDAGQVKQVLINLLRNAAVAISGARGRGRIRIKVANGGDGVRLDVWDSAGALAPEDRQRIFEPFFSRAQGGTGLGLSTVHTIVQAHGGTISVESSPATGTTFSVKLRSA
ncbi:MAG: ATP-binding protein [Archangium sp.]|nr:ATP-binding protein [Archangium sp.]